MAAPVKHPLRQTIERHKARLQAEFTRARLRKRCGSIEALKRALDEEKGNLTRIHPRWVRVNPLKAQNAEAVISSLPGFKEQPSQAQVLQDSRSMSYCPDSNVPDLYAFSPSADLTSTEAYETGQIILQDKASCFPAYLLLDDQPLHAIGDLIDGCAAPGNKTTHLAAISHKLGAPGKIFACERDSTRSIILQNMVTKAGAHQVEVLKRQDFLVLNPQDLRFGNVTHLLLDPSCSGSGILGREDMPQLALPRDPRAQLTKTGNKAEHTSSSNKKRKRNGHVEKEPGAPRTEPSSTEIDADVNMDIDLNEETPANPTDLTGTRLLKLSNLQTRIVEHAMAFPSAIRITYSTCSIHELENEVVVSRVLRSEIARSRGWRVLRRDEQVLGMEKWKHRGVKGESASPVATFVSNAEAEEGGSEHVNMLDEVELDACIRCSPDDGEGTMGFFVCGFVREAGDHASNGDGEKGEEDREDNVKPDEEEEEWGGFD